MATLETEVNWFSDETSRLKSHAMSMRKDMHHILSRIEALNEQRRFLNDQLKQILKRSKVLELEINGTATLNSIKIDDDLQLDITLHGNTLETDTASTEQYYDFNAKFQITNEKKNISGLWRGGKPSRAMSASASDVLQSSQLHARQSVKDTLISSSSSKNISSNLTLRRDPSYHLDQLLSQRLVQLLRTMKPKSPQPINRDYLSCQPLITDIAEPFLLTESSSSPRVA